MKLLQVLLYGVFRQRSYCNITKSFSILTKTKLGVYGRIFNNQLVSNISATERYSTNSNNEDNDDELLEDFPILEAEQLEQAQYCRNLLFKDSKDTILKELNKCGSVEELLNVYKSNKVRFKDQHITQTVFLLKDIQSTFSKYYGADNNSKDFIKNLYNDNIFNDFLLCIEENLKTFDPKYLSYVLFYLGKLGISVERSFMQKIILKVRDHLNDSFSLSNCSRFLKVVFLENSLRPYYMCVPIIPKVFHEIENLSSVQDLEYLTVCLNKLNQLVTNETLEKYKKKVVEFIDKKKLTSTDIRAILEIILFLNYPNWRNKNNVLISDCILMLKDEIHNLDINDLLILYEVFFKNQEPGECLNEIQRCSSKFLQQLEEETSPDDVEKKLRLFSSLIYFSSPIHRQQFRQIIQKYSYLCTSHSSLVLLRKMYSYVKISDEKLCTEYWNVYLNLFKDEFHAGNVIRACQNYMNFHTDIDNYRHYNFEKKMMMHINELMEQPLLYPSIISSFLSFVLVYGSDKEILQKLLDSFEENLTQFKPSDCLKISQSLQILDVIPNNLISISQTHKIKELLNKVTENMIEKFPVDKHFMQNLVIIKASILSNNYQNVTIENLLLKYKEIEFVSSKLMENFCFILLGTDILVPEIINKCTEYIIRNKDRVLAFNADKILFLCYYMAYYPINADKFFAAVTDCIIRDQERLSGLSFLHSALALCFFDKLPNSFIKQIFNVEFMDKLDTELANCYSKDKYPKRVRNSLMQLNRAVCLEYPECNVPWFHKKYVEDFQKKFIRDTEYTFPRRVKDYLIETLGTPQHILENVITPYGYHIDFVVNLDENARSVSSDSPAIVKRIALLLIRQYAYTRFYIHLKGKYQMKKRHLEIFGYTVALVNFNEWTNLLYAEERLEYLTNLLHLPNKDCTEYER